MNNDESWRPATTNDERIHPNHIQRLSEGSKPDFNPPPSNSDRSLDRRAGQIGAGFRHDGDVAGAGNVETKLNIST
jgi:hypothetical protein